MRGFGGSVFDDGARAKHALNADNDAADADLEHIRQEVAESDLLAALERIVLINGSTGGHKAMVAEFKHIARAAIDKARGEQP